MQFLFDAEELLRFFFLDGGDGDAGPAADDVFDVFAADDTGGRVVEVVFVAEGAEVIPFLAFFVGVEASLLEFVVRDGVFHAMDDELDALLDFGDLLGQGSLAQLHACAGFVDEVDSLVGEEAIGNVAIGMRDGEVDGFVGVADGVELLVAVLDAVDDFDGVFFVGRRNLDGLEAALEGTILLDGLAIFGGRGCADALNFAARKRGLEDVGGVEGTFSGAGANEGVELVDEDDGVLILHQLFHDGLEALFKLAAVFGAGDDERQIESEDALIGEEAGNVAVGDALGEAFDDGSLADAGFADEDGVVFGAAAEDLDDALQFLIAADEGIELGIHGGLGKVTGELGEERGFAVALLLGSFFLGGAGEFFAHSKELQAALVEDFGGEALFFAQEAEEQMFGANVLVGEALGLFRGIGQHTLAFIGEGEIDGGRDLLADGGVAFNLFTDGLDGSVRAKKAVGECLVFAEEPEQEMLGLDVRGAELAGLIPGEEDDAPRFFCIAFEHDSSERLRLPSRMPVVCAGKPGGSGLFVHESFKTAEARTAAHGKKRRAKIAGGPEAGAFVRIHPTCEVNADPSISSYRGRSRSCTYKPRFQLSVA